MTLSTLDNRGRTGGSLEKSRTIGWFKYLPEGFEVVFDMSSRYARKNGLLGTY
ncbi:hypothetical protein SAMN04244560_01837 [Thermoanaerobacter thermohydrosulfuricus]|uniref:Uncharacterized protein n=1 Tax=Thermoanaerobacter thermohydrosulfuricus TaxID=1516 RepID=A0A1G7RQU4_THETY|nr:hypothetical protein SAMN04244560_01837 [Thermoanaerobacter thermohydrosulfuricus]